MFLPKSQDVTSTGDEQPPVDPATVAGPAEGEGTSEPSPDADDFDPYTGAPLRGERKEREVQVGDVVRRRHFDPYTGPGGQEVEQVGIVTEVADGHARIAFLTSSDPVPLAELE